MLLRSAASLLCLVICLTSIHCRASKDAAPSTPPTETKSPAKTKHGDRVEFRFAPPTPLHFEKGHRTEVSVTLADGTVVNHLLEYDFDLKLTATSEGYELKRTTLKLDLLQDDGEKQDDPVEKLDIDFPISLLLDSTGRVSKVQGYVGYFEEAKKRFSPERYEIMIPNGEAAAMTEVLGSEQEHWDEMRGYFVGQKLAPGESYFLEVERSFGPWSTLTYSTQCKFVEMAKKFDRNLAFVQCYMASSPAFFRERFGFDYRGPPSTSVQSEEAGKSAISRDRWIDPETGLVYEESMTLHTEVEGMTVSHDRKYEIRYLGTD